MNKFIKLSIFSAIFLVSNIYGELITPPQLDENSSYVSSEEDNLGNTYLLYQNGSDTATTGGHSSKRGQLLKYNGSSWSVINSYDSTPTNNAELYINGVGYELRQNEMVIDSKNKVHILYINYGVEYSENALAYQRYNPNSNYLRGWESQIAPSGSFYHFSDGLDKLNSDDEPKPLATDLALDINSSDTPIVAYIDTDNSNKVKVRYLDDKGTYGTDTNTTNYADDTWESLGTLNITSSEIDMVVDNDIPYLAYKENSGGKVSVLKYESNIWKTLDANLSTDEVSNIKLSVEGDGNLYLYYVSNNKPITSKLRRYKALTVNEENTTIISLKPSNGSNITYSLIGGIDKDLFSISNDGNLSFIKVLSYETNEDNNSDGVYEVDLRILDNDTNLSAYHSFNVSLNDVNEKPEITSTAILSVNEDSNYTYDLNGSDVDRDSLSWSATNGTSLPSWLSLDGDATVTTFAGRTSVSGSDNGNGTSASFSGPNSITVDSSGNLYVVDGGNHLIRKIDTNGNVTTIAGSGSKGNANGAGTSASFNSPEGIAIDSIGNLYVADTNNHLIRKIDTNGNVTTIAGTGKEGSVNANGTSASFNKPAGIDIDSSGNVYVADRANHQIRKIDKDGNVTTIAGSGSSGSANGNGSFASFNNPYGVSIDSSGIIYVADSSNNLIRKIDTNGDVTTFAGSGDHGNSDGNGISASFSQPYKIDIDNNGNLYVIDKNNHNIKKIDRNRNVTIVAGNGILGRDNGSGLQSSFYFPKGIAVAGDGSLYIADSSNNLIRKIKFSTKLTGTPTNDDVGVHDINLTLSDGEHNVTQNFKLTVVNVNDAPKLNTNYGNIFMNEDDSFRRFDLNISDVDVDENLTLTITSSDTSVIIAIPNFINPIGAATYSNLLDFDIHTVLNASGKSTITLTLSDGKVNTSKSFDITVRSVDDKPVLEGIGNKDTNEDSASSFIKLKTTDVDSDVSKVKYSVSSSDNSKVDVQVVDGVLIITPKEDATGTVTISVTATVDGESITEIFTYTLNSVNDRPNIAHLDDIFLDENGSALSGTINFTIYDDVNITSWEVKSSNQNLLKDENLSLKKVSETNASLSYTIGANKTGKTKVKVTVKDDENLSYSELFYITVARSNDELCVENTKTALTFDVIKNANISQKYITDDLRLVDTMRNVCSAKIKWNSSKSTVIGNDGVVNIPASDTTLALTATISKGAESTTKQFLLTVVPLASNISDAEAVAKVTFQDIKNTNRRQDQIVADLTLVSSSLGKDINWSSTDVNNTIIDLYTFKVTRPDSNGSDTNVTLTATIGDSSKEFNLTVIAMLNNTGDKLAKDREWLNFARILDKNRDNNNVIYDLIKPLPSSAPNGSTISWETSNLDVITTDGDVTRSSTGDRYVTMTASFTNSGITDTKEFLLRVLENKTTTSNDVNVSFEQVIDNNETGAVAVSFKEDGEDANTTASFDDSLVSKLEKIISDDSVQSVIELADKIINLFLNTDGTAQSQAEFTNDNNESVISSIKIDSRKSSTNVDGNGTVVSTVAFDATTTLKAELNSDGSVSHTVEANGGSSTKTTKASSSIPGSQVQADNAGNVETTSEVKSGNVIYKAVALSDKDGKTKTKFVIINLSTGEETEVDNTLDDSTPYAAGNTVEISEINGTVYIKTIAPLDGNLSVK